MSELIEYFTRHLTLVIDNDQQPHEAANRAARRVVRDSDITKAEWLALSSRDRELKFAADIGDKVMELINAWFTESVVPDTIGGQIAHEVMILADSELEWELGKHYMPEDADIVDLLESDEDDEGE